MRSLSITLVSLLLSCASMAAAHADAIDDYIQEQMARYSMPGLALSIVQDGILQRAQGYGYANLEHRVPVHPDTVFQSGSVGKMFTATVVLLLVEEGKLRLDESVRTYLTDSLASWQPITVRYLLTHTSGLQQDPGFDLRKDYTDQELLRILYHAKQNASAGEQFSYSNTAYVVLGLLIKKVSGRRYIDVLKERVFAPLNMNTAGMIDDRGIVMNRASGYEVRDGGAYLNQEWIAPTGNSTADGSLYLTALDWAKWEAAVRARKVLKPESWAEMFAPVRLNSGETYDYGFGWRLSTFAGQTIQEHGGSWQGFRAFYTRYVERGLAIIVLTNGRSEADLKVLARQVAGLFDPQLAELTSGTGHVR